MKHDDIMKLALVELQDGTIQQIVVGADEQSFSTTVQVAFTSDIHPDFLNIMIAGPMLYQMLTIEHDSLNDMQTICDMFGEIAQTERNALYASRVRTAKEAIANRQNIIADLLKVARDGMPTANQGPNNESQTKH